MINQVDYSKGVDLAKFIQDFGWIFVIIGIYCIYLLFRDYQKRMSQKEAAIKLAKEFGWIVILSTIIALIAWGVLF